MSGLQAAKRLGKGFLVRSFVDKDSQIHHWVGKHIIKKLVPREGVGVRKGDREQSSECTLLAKFLKPLQGDPAGEC